MLGYSPVRGRTFFSSATDGLVTSLDGLAFDLAYGGAALPQDLVAAAAVPAEQKEAMEAAGNVAWQGASAQYSGKERVKRG